MITCGSEISFCPITTVTIVEMKIVASVSYDSCTRWCKLRMAIWFKLESLRGDVAFHINKYQISKERSSFKRTMTEDVEEKDF